MLLTARQTQIFQAIVEDYISFAEPVGSRTISKKFNIPISSATIRNEMSDLEDMGLITQQHLSSGRVPTQKGMRFYVDCILELDRLSDEETDAIKKIKDEYARKKQHIRELMKDVSRAMTSTMDYPSIIVAPKLSSEKFKKIQFMLVDDENILITLISRSGLIEHFSLKIDFPVTQEKLDHVASNFNCLSAGFTLEEVDRALYSEFMRGGRDAGEGCGCIMRLLKGSECDNIDERVFMNGAENIFKNPEFQNSEKVKLFIQILNDKEKLIKLMYANSPKNYKNDTLVLIGSELFDFAALDLGLVASEYSGADDATGLLGIIGPSRMEYGRVITIVREIASRLSNILREK